jgi:hypothetical protein
MRIVIFVLKRSENSHVRSFNLTLIDEVNSIRVKMSTAKSALNRTKSRSLIAGIDCSYYFQYLFEVEKLEIHRGNYRPCAGAAAGAHASRYL